MTKYQRAKARIAKDKIDKQNRFRMKHGDNDCFEKVITRQHYVDALNKCQRGVRWKKSVQEYCQNAVIEINRAITSLYEGRLPKLTNTRRITLSERGKKRVIVPISIRDRMTQRVLCDGALVPVLQRSLIYDNGASMKGKGVDFTRKRLRHHINEAIREYGSDFYALTFDFKSFFDSIPHKTCLKILSSNFRDRRIIGLTMRIIKSYQEAMIRRTASEQRMQENLALLEANELRGICLGSQISQIMALAVPNKLDHYIKDEMGVKHYIRYMDDGVIFAKDKQFLFRLLDGMKKICKELGLTFNEKKTKVTKISRGFTFLKVRYRITQTGKVVKTLTKAGIVRMRRKMKKFRKLVDVGKMTMDDVYNSVQSWAEHSTVAMSYKTRKNMMALYNKLFGGYRLTKKYEHIKGGKNGELLQIDKWQHLRWSCDAA